MTLQTKRKIFKILVVGDAGVGKTCLAFRFRDGKCSNDHKVTAGLNFLVRSLNIEGEEVMLQLWDTAGTERYHNSLANHYFRNAHAVVIVYDVTKMASFQNLPKWLEECEEHGLTSEMPRILVGNKCDSKDSLVVSTHIAQQFANTHSMPLFETSALSESEGSTVESIVEELAQKLLKMHPMMAVQHTDAISLANPTVIRKCSWSRPKC